MNRGNSGVILMGKLGPVHAVRQAESMIDPARPVVVNYCDFTCYWDWLHFKEFVAESQCTGAIPAYKGFHPHTLGSTNYAYMRESNGWVEDIQEKQPYTDNRMDEYASSGTYYFNSGKMMLEAFQATVKQGLNVGGEYYVSLAYKPLLAEKKPVAVYPLEHFMQWGTPEDLAEYKGWSKAFRGLIGDVAKPFSPKGSLVIPMAGLGQRFTKEGYKDTKPLIKVSGKSMVVQATNDLPASAHQVFVLRSDMPGFKEVTEELTTEYHSAIIATIPEVTEGQACTALIGIDELERKVEEIPGPITIGACDNGALYDAVAFNALVNNPEVDVIVWAVRGHSNAARHPEMFGWIDADEDGMITRIAVKQSLGSPSTHPIVLGTFTFKKAEDYRRAINHLINRDGRVNGEFYIDSCINDAIALGMNCRLFEVDSYLSWGTPNDLRTFEYWQSCFSKWDGHPYQLEQDSRIAASALSLLQRRYSMTVPVLPGARS